jgi:hypothetical protein
VHTYQYIISVICHNANKTKSKQTLIIKANPKIDCGLTGFLPWFFVCFVWLLYRLIDCNST